jgi:GH25 family lysozyme M1 (1,4-beta-N-acetylmuramidase)
LRAVRAVKPEESQTYISQIDKNFAKNWIELENRKIRRGAYHFFAPDVPAEIQFETFKKAVNLKKGDLPPILDVENRSCDMDEAMK